MATSLFKKEQSLYSCSAVEDLVNRYIEAGGEVFTIEEGSLGYGFMILHSFGGGLKTYIVKEKYLNCWSSAHTIRGYNKIPAKYEKILLEHIEKQGEEDVA